MTRTPPSGAARFSAVLRQPAGKNATGLVVPPEIIEQLGAGKKPPVRVTVNGYEYRTTIGVMSGTAMVPVSAAVRKDAGLAAGDEVDVQLVVDTSTRDVRVPEDLAAELAANPEAKRFFETLSNSLQRYHVDNIDGAKTVETRQRRVDKAIRLFLDETPR